MYDSFVRDAFPLKGIAVILGMNGYQRAQQYLQNTRQHQEWRWQHQLQLEEQQQAEREEQIVKQDIVNLLL